MYTRTICAWIYFFFNDTATTEIYTLSLHDALPISLDLMLPEAFAVVREAATRTLGQRHYRVQIMGGAALHLGNIAEMKTGERSEEHTSELQSRQYLVCRLLLEKKKKAIRPPPPYAV